ncbi:DUF2339 domain-containing protein [Foetidibacter luteolus]|uniref:DUF2339 domain-containing protein n=1 Tax=Foetidibacter luteolus TaxID=2608880 RepID=UPI00129B17B3|nr:DUF2339 domain-containing protein [Foetidibacter luteolus]
METLLLTLVIILLIILASMNKKLGGINTLLEETERLNRQITELNSKVEILQRPRPGEEKPPEKERPAAPPVPQVKREITPDAAPPMPVKEKPGMPTPAPQQDKPVVIIAPQPQKQQPDAAPPPEESWFDKWLRNNPDIEKFIGENLVNKIGIGVLVLGIAFFVKYAIDQDWINEVGRVCIGMLCGALLIGVAHWLRNSYKAFSSVLVGGGLVVFYFTIAFAFHQYQLFSQQAAFIIMVVITGFAVALSVLYDRLEIAVLATVGGFLTPFLVSTGQGNYIVLFTYLCILNAGLIVLALYKRWRVLNFIAFVFTMFIYGGWVVSETGTERFSYSGTFLFGTVFYLMFLAMNVIHHAGRGSKLKAVDLSLLLAINLWYYAAGAFLLHEWAPEFKGLFTALLGLINLAMAYTFYRRNSIDRNFVFLLIGLTLSYISLAAPVQLTGNYITLFWATEMLVLFWLYQKSGIGLVKIASAIITILVTVSLLMDWGQVYPVFYSSKKLLPVVANKGFVTGIFTAFAMGGMHLLFKKEANSYYAAAITNKAVGSFYFSAFLVLLYVTGALEINYQFSQRFSGTGMQHVWLQLYSIVFLGVLFIVFARQQIIKGANTWLILSALLFLYYLLNIPNIYRTEKLVLSTGSYRGWFAGHWLGAAILLWFMYSMVQHTRQRQAQMQGFINAFTWLAVIAIVILLSVEIRNMYVWMMYKDPASVSYAENLYSKAGLSIVWGLSSFALIWLGLQKRVKTLRVIALLLFGLTLLKLFAYDIKNIPPGGKIAAFILLGVLLLVVSFMYQRIKKILIDDASKP